MTHWIEDNLEQLDELRNIVDDTSWNLEYGSAGPVELNNEDSSQISIARITFTGRENYYKLQKVNDTDPFTEESDPQRTEEGSLDEIVQFTRMTVENH